MVDLGQKHAKYSQRSCESRPRLLLADTYLMQLEYVKAYSNVK